MIVGCLALTLVQMIWLEEELVMVSAVEHYGYCPRQCALIHVEHVYDENVFTIRGSLAHDRVDKPSETSESGVRVERALPIWSEQYGLIGKADMVEFRSDGIIRPIEYKYGSRHRNNRCLLRAEDLQVCAQAICLEEMFGRPVLTAAIYSISTRKRREIELSEHLRRRTLDTVQSIRTMVLSGKTPEPVSDNRCPNCSLVHVCMPFGVNDLANLDSEDVLFQPCGKEVEDD